MFTVKYFGVKAEAELIESFLEWQGTPCSIEDDPSTLKISRGHGCAFLFKDGEVVAKGFYEVVEYWKKNGLTYC